MPKITNQELSDLLVRITAKMEAEKAFTKEHRSWEIKEMEKLHIKIDEQNVRILKNEIKLVWFKGITPMFSVFMGWLFKRTF